MVFVSLFFGFVQRFLIGVLLVSDEAGFFGSPGRMGDPLIVEHGSA